MKTLSISFFDNFKCDMGECINTCCRGWRIPVDYDSYRKYLKTGVIQSAKFLFNIREADGTLVLNKNSGKCPYENEEGLCGIQLKYGEDYLCDVCRIYPRTVYNFGYHAEKYLDLSCPSVARLLMESVTPFDFKESEEEINAPVYGTNDDPLYLELLINVREKILGFIMNEENPFELIENRLFKLGKELQTLFFEERCETVSIEFADRIIGITESILSGKREESEDTCQSTDGRLQPIDKVMRSGFYHSKLQKTSPLMYRLCRLYFSKIDSANKAAGYTEAMADDDILEYVRKYLGYKIATYFMQAYEDFCFVRRLSIPIYESRMLWLFLWLYKDSGEIININNTCNIISAFERRICHRDKAQDELFETCYNSQFQI